MTYDPRLNTIAGWMSHNELRYLYDLSTQSKNIMELGSCHGRSTHALLSGGAQITAVDTWCGSVNDCWSFPNDDVGSGVMQQSADEVFAAFQRNVGRFPNLTVFRGLGMDAVQTFPDQHFDACFIDAAHGYDDVKADILAWLPKCKHILCGHDYGNGHVGVKRAVDELFGGPEGRADAIWWITIK